MTDKPRIHDRSAGDGNVEPKPLDKQTLAIATGLAAITAIVVLTFFILPAEYGIDPTRVGEAFGIKQIAAPADAGITFHAVEDGHFRVDQNSITVPPATGLEFKFQIDQGSGFVYSWNATGQLYFDFHGEPANDTTGYFESYEIATKSHADGSFNAPFTGSHGWYWRNDSNATIAVTLETVGHYEVVGLV